MTLLKKITLIVCLLWTGIASAVSLGGIKVNSALGQPLQAEINLVAVTPAEQASLAAKLASPAQFKSAGIDYPYSLPMISFTIATRADGESFIKLTSDQPLNEPTVNLFLELNWSAGKLLREYNFLLVTPAVLAEKLAETQSVLVEPVATPLVPLTETAATVVTPAAVEVPVQSPPETAPVTTDAPKETVAASDVLPHAEPTTTQAISITVKRGDTLTKLAQQNKPADVSLERMLVALYRANAQVFDAKNMNRIQAGKILQLPASAQIAAVQQAEAITEIHAQVSDWNRYRQQLAQATGKTVEAPVAKQESQGKVGTAVTDKAASVKPSAKEVLKLSKGELPNAASSDAVVKSTEEEMVANDKALKDAQQRTRVLEKNIQDLKRLAALKAEAANASASAAPSSAVNLAADDASLKNELTNNPIYLAVLIVVLLVAAITIYVRPRQVTPTAEVAPVQSAVTKGSLDLLAEANLQLNFGRSVKAEELLKKAIHLDPTNIAIKTALLEIYADRKDSASFNSLAIEIKDSNDDDAWLKVASLGRELDPKNQLYVATQNSESVASSPQILAAESAAIVETVADKKAGSPVANDINLKEISLHLDDSATGHSAATATDNKEAIWHEVATKIDLAKAYQAMGEVAGMREILKEVMREGDDGQRQIAQKMLQSLG